MFKQCSRCGSNAAFDAQACPQCGLLFPPQNYQASPPGAQSPHQGFYPHPATNMPGMIWVPPGTHSIVAAILVSVFFGGWAGALVNRQTAKGLLFWGLGGLAFSVITCGWAAIIIYPLSLIDAILIANRLNRGEPVGPWQFF